LIVDGIEFFEGALLALQKLIKLLGGLAKLVAEVFLPLVEFLEGIGVLKHCPFRLEEPLPVKIELIHIVANRILELLERTGEDLVAEVVNPIMIHFLLRTCN